MTNIVNGSEVFKEIIGFHMHKIVKDICTKKLLEIPLGRFFHCGYNEPKDLTKTETMNRAKKINRIEKSNSNENQKDKFIQFLRDNKSKSRKKKTNFEPLSSNPSSELSSGNSSLEQPKDLYNLMIHRFSDWEEKSAQIKKMTSYLKEIQELIILVENHSGSKLEIISEHINELHPNIGLANQARCLFGDKYFAMQTEGINIELFEVMIAEMIKNKFETNVVKIFKVSKKNY
ncbi:hypothetical protein CWI37_0580p0010 [Hamiltosporidium tvaerminnensis]|uniref:Uncharacterized protein n=1 Tax=Hamiltosporidium tvaerminnensis TaxID=1176355 RepID=A0A4Q9L3C7_9MICR|nr:hypothetical protein CWI37_0580p0010 [Hamiltosporidium tvaerminnensis]